MLILPIKKKWFDMIKSGEKKEEYREIKPYYTSRFDNMTGNDIKIDYELDAVTFCVIFRNGYSRFSPELKCRCKLRTDFGKEKWGAEPNKKYYILDILEVIR